jgi:uncharacterized membrane protein
MNGTGKPTRKMLSIYIPNPPNPTSGVFILVPESEAKVLNMSIEEGLKLVLSGGIVSPTEPLAIIKPLGKQRRKRGS